MRDALARLVAAVEALPTEAWWTGAPKHVYQVPPAAWKALMEAVPLARAALGADHFNVQEATIRDLRDRLRRWEEHGDERAHEAVVTATAQRDHVERLNADLEASLAAAEARIKELEHG